MKLRTIGMVAVALALVAGRAQAQDAGWDSQYGAVFGIGIDGAPLADYDGKVGLQYNLDPQTALRFGVQLARHACGGTETDDGIGGTVTKSVCGSLSGAGLASANSTLGIGLSAEYLMRTSAAAVAPYFGGGVYVDFNMASRKGETESDVSPFTPYEYNNSSSQFGFGLLGKAGLEWRINKVIALFAEYQLSIDVIRRTSTTMDEKQGATVFDDEKRTQTNILNLDTGLANGGLLGVVAFF